MKRYRTLVLLLLACWAMMGLGTACQCKKINFATGAIKFPIVTKPTLPAGAGKRYN